MRHIVHHYVHAFLFEVFQSAACNMVHSVRQRFTQVDIYRLRQIDRYHYPPLTPLP